MQMNLRMIWNIKSRKIAEIIKYSSISAAFTIITFMCGIFKTIQLDWLHIFSTVTQEFLKNNIEVFSLLLFALILLNISSTLYILYDSDYILKKEIDRNQEELRSEASKISNTFKDINDRIASIDNRMYKSAADISLAKSLSEPTIELHTFKASEQLKKMKAIRYSGNIKIYTIAQKTIEGADKSLKELICTCCKKPFN